MESRLRLLGILLMLFSIAIHAGGIKKWRDQSGNIHFGDAPPANADSEPVKPKVIPPSPKHDTLQTDFLRPSERRMLQRYEQRGKDLSAAREDDYRRLQQQRQERARAAAKCRYHRSQIENLKGQLRRGYKWEEKDKIERELAQHRENRAQFCE